MDKNIEYNSKKLFYRTEGNGLPVIFLHGFAEDHRVWDGQAEALREDYQVIVPDLPGSGGSALTEDMSMEGMADSINYILKAERIHQCIMIGHSMGGYITLAFAALFPDTLKAFGLFHSTAYADSEEKKETRRKGIRFIQQNSAFEFIKTATPNLYSATTKESQPSLIEKHLDCISYFSKEPLIAYYQAMLQRPDRTSVLTESKVPVLFILGEQDNAVPLEDGLKQCHLPALSSVEILSHSGHMGMQEETEKSNKILKEFAAIV